MNAFGTGNSAYKLNNAIGGSQEVYFPTIDLKNTFGVQWGLKLRMGSTDKLMFTIRDNCSAPDTFNIIGYGIKSNGA